MPWNESHIMDERVKFISRLLDGERMTDLCKEFGISRKTGYKFLDRYQKAGVPALVDGSHSPSYIPHKTGDEIERMILNLRVLRSTWGPKKLKVKLEKLNPGMKFPAASTIGDILDRNGLIKARASRRKRFYPTELTDSTNPNDIWCVDFKGQFRLGNRAYCYPLTVTDHWSRYLLGCESLENTTSRGARTVFESVFQEYGLPSAIRSDNGTPFASCGIYGLSRLSVWWIKLGIRIEHIEPGCPEQNGRHERMHLTLKQEVTRPAAKNHLQQQEKFDHFRNIFNEERPHEALAMKTPSDIYKPSHKKYSPAVEPLEYPTHDQTRTVGEEGSFKLGAKKIYIGQAFGGEQVGLRQLTEAHWLVTFAALDLGYLDAKTGTFGMETPLNPKGSD